MTRTRVETLVLVLALLGACGGEKSQPEAPPAAPQPAAPSPAPAAPTPPAAPVVVKPDADGTVHLTADDTMHFNATRIEVPAAQLKIKVELKNVGAVPKEAMGHNFVLLKPGPEKDGMALLERLGGAAASMAAKPTDYMPPAAMPQVIAHSKLLGPGETDTIEITLPGPGTYPFLCTFPGHAALMHGELVVQ